MNIEKKFHLKTTYTLYLIGFFFNVFLPGAIGGDVMRAKYSSEYCQIKLKDAGFIVASERLFGLLSILILFASGVFFNTGMLPKLGINNLFWYTPTLVIIVMCAIYWVSRQIIIKRGMFLPVLILSGIAQLADIIIVFLYSTYFNLGLSIGNLLVVMPLVYIATILPISLGGLGVREGALVGLMALFQVDVSTAVIISFMLYLTKVAVGIIGMPVFIKTKAYHSL